ncbi:hypothetical protein IWQ62_003184, partial [Dispira parvispora]
MLPPTYTALTVFLMVTSIVYASPMPQQLNKRSQAGISSRHQHLAPRQQIKTLSDGNVLDLV